MYFGLTAATTLGADSLFKGTVIDDAGITVGNNVTREGRALDYATTVTTNNSTITNTCGGAAGTGMLHVIKTVVGGSALPSDFRLYVNYGGAIVGSGLGTGGIGTLYIITGGTYTVSEDANSSYTQSLGVNCSNVTIFSGDDKTCIITNTYITPPSGGGGGWSPSKDSCPKGDYSSGYYDGTCGIVPITTGNVAPIVLFSSVVTGTIVVSNSMTSTPLGTPGFPKTGIISQETIIPWNLILLASILTALSISSIVLLKKQIAIK
ncbi:MAG: hypothetical protein NTY80_02930 [candidate division SR1 bacterium]|nr:hypothetical protein [candidate division SR1 bacterium]